MAEPSVLRRGKYFGQAPFKQMQIEPKMPRTSGQGFPNHSAPPFQDKGDGMRPDTVVSGEVGGLVQWFFSSLRYLIPSLSTLSKVYPEPFSQMACNAFSFYRYYSSGVPVVAETTENKSGKS